MSNTHVRQATLSDLESVAELFDRYRRFQGQASDPARARTFLQARLEREESVLLVAGKEGRDVGFAQLFPSFTSVSLARVYILNDLFVVSDARRGGIATALLDAVERHAWSQGATRLTLTTARRNTSAQKLYDARGWRKDEAFFVYHRYALP